MAIHFNSGGIVTGNGGDPALDCCCDNLGDSEADFGIDFDGFESSACGTADCVDLNDFRLYLIFDPDSGTWVAFGAGFSIQVTRVGDNWELIGYAEDDLGGTECFKFTQPVNGGTRPTISPWTYVSGCGSSGVITIGVWNPPDPDPGAVRCDAGVSCCNPMSLTVSNMTPVVGFCGGCLCHNFNGTYTLYKFGRTWSTVNSGANGSFAMLQCFDDVWYLTLQCPKGLDCAVYSTANTDDCVPEGVYTAVSGLCTTSNIDPNPISVVVSDDCAPTVCPDCDDDICVEASFTGWTGGAFACTFINDKSCVGDRFAECDWREGGGQPCDISTLRVFCLDWAGGNWHGFCGEVPAGIYWEVEGSPNGGTSTFFGLAPVLAGETYPGSLGGGARTCEFVCDDEGCGDGTITIEGVTCI